MLEKQKNLNQTYYSHLSGTECEWTKNINL